ncbi:MAG: TIGR01212 family radical SAM protein, partial [Oscillospiraceae bacterium]|nr:TIGR01212 family radical SAM protein [Oscillospiraceae bacterium]MBQ2146203.1 TIGR01212 family radical SAM protein [Oscillospiraceae bacterium]
LSLDEYAELVCKCLDILPETTVIHRITGDPPKKILIAPAWCADKKTVINTLNKKLNRFG